MQNQPKVEMILVSCPDLLNIMSGLHLWIQSDIDLLVDIWNASAPDMNMSQNGRLLVGLKHYDPRKDNITKRYVLPNSLANWIKDASEKRGYPFTYEQAMNLVKGRKDYGRGQIANQGGEKKLFTVT